MLIFQPLLDQQESRFDRRTPFEKVLPSPIAPRPITPRESQLSAQPSCAVSGTLRTFACGAAPCMAISAESLNMTSQTVCTQKHPRDLFCRNSSSSMRLSHIFPPQGYSFNHFSACLVQFYVIIYLSSLGPRAGAPGPHSGQA